MMQFNGVPHGVPITHDAVTAALFSSPPIDQASYMERKALAQRIASLEAILGSMKSKYEKEIDHYKTQLCEQISTFTKVRNKAKQYKQECKNAQSQITDQTKLKEDYDRLCGQIEVERKHWLNERGFKSLESKKLILAIRIELEEQKKATVEAKSQIIQKNRENEELSEKAMRLEDQLFKKNDEVMNLKRDVIDVTQKYKLLQQEVVQAKFNAAKLKLRVAYANCEVQIRERSRMPNPDTYNLSSWQICQDDIRRQIETNRTRYDRYVASLHTAEEPDVVRFEEQPPHPPQDDTVLLVPLQKYDDILVGSTAPASFQASHSANELDVLASLMTESGGITSQPGPFVPFSIPTIVANPPSHAMWDNSPVSPMTLMMPSQLPDLPSYSASLGRMPGPPPNSTTAFGIPSPQTVFTNPLPQMTPAGSMPPAELPHFQIIENNGPSQTSAFSNNLPRSPIVAPVMPMPFLLPNNGMVPNIQNATPHFEILDMAPSHQAETRAPARQFSEAPNVVISSYSPSSDTETRSRNNLSGDSQRTEHSRPRGRGRRNTTHSNSLGSPSSVPVAFQHNVPGSTGSGPSPTLQPPCSQTPGINRSTVLKNQIREKHPQLSETEINHYILRVREENITLRQVKPEFVVKRVSEMFAVDYPQSQPPLSPASSIHNMCVICHDALQGPKAGIRARLACGHDFHKDCVNAWFATQNHTCPTCRSQQNPFDHMISGPSL